MEAQRLEPPWFKWSTEHYSECAVPSRGGHHVHLLVGAGAGIVLSVVPQYYPVCATPFLSYPRTQGGTFLLIKYTNCNSEILTC